MLFPDYNEREYRDIDILVNSEDLKKAYTILLNLGFEYKNKNSKKGIKFIRGMHHIPTLIDDNGVIVEIHFRLTLKKYYDNCPLLNDALRYKQNINGINIPSIEIMVSHCFYHGVVHHKLSSGPIFLFDLKRLSKKTNLNSKKILNLVNSLKLLNKYTHVIGFIEQHKNSEVIKIDDYENLLKHLGINGFFQNKERKQINIRHIIDLLKFYSFSYQLSYVSPTYYKIILKKLFQKLLKARE